MAIPFETIVVDNTGENIQKILSKETPETPEGSGDFYKLRNTVQKTFSNVSYNHANGEITFTYVDGTTQVVDLPSELRVQNGYYDTDNKNIVLVLANGDNILIPAGDIGADMTKSLAELDKDLVDDTYYGSYMYETGILLANSYIVSQDDTMELFAYQARVNGNDGVSIRSRHEECAVPENGLPLDDSGHISADLYAWQSDWTEWENISFHDAPDDGRIYGRQNGSWTDLTNGLKEIEMLEADTVYEDIYKVKHHTDAGIEYGVLHSGLTFTPIDDAYITITCKQTIVWNDGRIYQREVVDENIDVSVAITTDNGIKHLNPSYSFKSPWCAWSDIYEGRMWKEAPMDNNIYARKNGSWTTLGLAQNDGDAGLVRIGRRSKGLEWTSDDAGGQILVVRGATISQIRNSSPETLVIRPNYIPAAVAFSTHQNMSDDYNTDSILTHESMKEYKSQLPASYGAVKRYVDESVSKSGAISNGQFFDMSSKGSYDIDYKIVPEVQGHYKIFIKTLSCSSATITIKVLKTDGSSYDKVYVGGIYEDFSAEVDDANNIVLYSYTCCDAYSIEIFTSVKDDSTCDCYILARGEW